MKEKKFVILGAQASGKGTQAEILGKKLKIPVIGMGDLLRAEGKRKTARGRLINSIINVGGFVPFEITNNLIEREIARVGRRGFIIDGYPRHMIQARFLNELVPEIRIIFIKISDKEAKKRISSRRICAKCGKIFNLITDRPKKNGLCDFCGGRLILRDDDKPRAINRRLRFFHKETEPVLKFFSARGRVIEVNGEQPIKKVAREIFKKIR
jgi:adenylate kinase